MDPLFVMKLFKYFMAIYDQRINLINKRTEIKYIEHLLNDVKYNKIIEPFGGSCSVSRYIYYLFISKMIITNHLEPYNRFYSDEILPILKENLEFYKNSQTRLSLINLNILFGETLFYLFDHTDLLIEILLELIDYINLDPKNYENIFNQNKNIFMKFNRSRNINFIKFYESLLNSLNKKPEICSNAKKLKFMVNITKRLMIPRIHKLFNNIDDFENNLEIDNFNKISNFINQ